MARQVMTTYLQVDHVMQGVGSNVGRFINVVASRMDALNDMQLADLATDIGCLLGSSALKVLAPLMCCHGFCCQT